MSGRAAPRTALESEEKPASGGRVDHGADFVMMARHAEFRFYEELNDFLPVERRKVAFDYGFTGTPSVKDTIEAIGVPHVEVDLILVDGMSVDFTHLLRGGERVAVYPVFERLDIAPITRLRPVPLRAPRFIVDVHLGKLARLLRLLGFDTVYEQGHKDATIARRAQLEHRIVLTRDVGLLKRRDVTHGHWIRHTEPRRQLVEVIESFDLRARVRPFFRCMMCNGELERIPEAGVRERLPSGVRGRFEEIAQCLGCARLYWPGSHYERLARLVADLVAE